MELIDKLNQTIKLLDEIEAYGNELVNRLTDVNYRISDIEHKIENEKLKTNQCYRVVQRLKDLRIERRKKKKYI